MAYRMKPTFYLSRHHPSRNVWSSRSQNVAPGSIAPASSGSLLEMQILRPHQRPAESEMYEAEGQRGSNCVLMGPF